MFERMSYIPGFIENYESELSWLEHHAQQGAEYVEKQRATLTRSDGSPIYAPDEMAEREAAILEKAVGTYDAGVARYAAKAEADAADLTKQVALLEHDVFDGLKPEEQQRASLRREFVKEDCLSLPAHELEKQVRAALAAPNALALIATTFPVGRPRNRAMAVYGAMSALGITIGVLLGGILTGMLSWRWVFFINIPIGLAVLAGTAVLVEGQRNRGRLDTPDAVSGTGAMVALAYGITRGGEHGWGDAVTLGALLAALALAALFVLLQARREDPMLPLGLLGDRNRSGSYATMLFIGAGLMGTFYLLTLYLQQVLQFSPLATGLASLPFSVGIILGSAISSKLVERLAPRAVAVPGLLVAASGLYWLSTLTMDSSYATHIMPALFLASFGLGLSFVPMTLTAVYGVAEERAGVASALVNMAQQIGAALGLAVLTTISISSANGRLLGAAEVLREGLAGNDGGVVATASAALAHGYTTGFLAGAAMLLVAAVIAALAVSAPRQQNTAESSTEVQAEATEACTVG